MESHVTVSVIMPVYNAEKYLDEAITSILRQTYTNFELIIVNDGSTDSSLQIIRYYAGSDKRIRIIDRPNKGLIASLNEAIDIAKGDYIARMDADDCSLSVRFEKQVAYLSEHNADLVGGHYLDMNSAGKIVNTTIVPVGREALIACLALRPPFAHGSVMFRRSFWVNNGMKYGQRFKEAEDYALWQEFYTKGARLANIDEFIFKYRQHGESFSAGKLRKMNNEVKLLRKIFIKHHKKELKGVLSALQGIQEKSFSEESIMLELGWLLFRYTGNMKFFGMLLKANKKNAALVLIKIASRTI